jgi:hypothetical protein
VVGVQSRTQLRWIGPVTPTSNPAQCPATKGVLLMRQNKVTFAPSEGIWILEGTAKGDTIEAFAGRVGVDRKDYDTSLQAHWTEANVTGTYTTPRCTYNVALTRQ